MLVKIKKQDDIMLVATRGCTDLKVPVQKRGG